MRMHKVVSKINALLNGGISINYINKTPVSRPPGDVTDMGHN